MRHTEKRNRREKEQIKKLQNGGCKSYVVKANCRVRMNNQHLLEQ